MGSAPFLVADDDTQVREVLTRFFEHMDLDNPVLAFADGDAALAYLERAVAGDAEVPALLVLDEHMPGATGREILRWRNDHRALKATPVIILTGDSIGSDIDVLLDATFIMKPVSFEQLVEVVSDLKLSE